MKNLVLLISLPVLAFAALVSCNQLDIFQKNDASSLISEIAAASKTTVDPTALPANLTRYVATNYFETYIASADKANKAGYEVTLGSADVLYFDLEGTSLDSMATCHSDSMGGHHGRHGHGGPGGDHPTGNCGGVDSLLEVNTLPADIQAYVTTIYGESAVIEHAKTNLNGQYVVEITGHVILIFDASGTFVEAANLVHACEGHHGTPIAIADLVQPITDYLAANYAGAEIKVAFQKGSDKIIVGLLYNGARTILIFDATGNFLEVRN